MRSTQQQGHSPTVAGAGPQEIDTVVIGGGQAGLTVGYYLAKRNRDFVILDANHRVGDSWRERWDSLLLFTPARLNCLPGMKFPGPGDKFVTKDEMADFLETYATRFKLPVRNGVRVDRLAQDGGSFLISAGEMSYRANNVVVAMANSQVPWIPAFAQDLDPGIVQLHSKDYRNPTQLQDGAVLVVGAGNSGADIAMEVAASHPTLMAGKETAHVPFRIETFVARHLLVRIVRFMGHRVLSVRTPVGRKVRSKMLRKAPPLVRVKPKDLTAAGVERFPRVTGIRGGLPITADDRTLEVKNVIWCTGFRPGFSWIDLPILGDRQEPAHENGVVLGVPGLYFVGLHFLYAATSETITGMPRDAKRIVKHIAARERSRQPAEKPAVAQLA